MSTLAPPIRFEPAYDDREAVRSLVHRGGPYPLMWTSSGYGAMSGERADPWFRAHWGLDGVATDPAAAPLLRDERFIDVAKALLDATVVRPSTLLLNVMGPMGRGPVHVDTPSFRGLKRAEVPIWLLVSMGASGLFERWAVRVAGVLTWFYEGNDGEYEYWPHGRRGASECERGPFGNVALAADNDRMPHRVGPIGDADAFAARVRVTPGSVVERDGDGWRISDRDGSLGTMTDDEARVSILWKAIAFADDADRRRHDEHLDDIDLGTVVAVLTDDLRARGHDVVTPADALADRDWVRLVTSTYIGAPS